MYDTVRCWRSYVLIGVRPLVYFLENYTRAAFVLFLFQRRRGSPQRSSVSSFVSPCNALPNLLGIDVCDASERPTVCFAVSPPRRGSRTTTGLRLPIFFGRSCTRCGLQRPLLHEALRAVLHSSSLGRRSPPALSEEGLRSRPGVVGEALLSLLVPPRRGSACKPAALSTSSPWRTVLLQRRGQGLS